MPTPHSAANGGTGATTRCDACGRPTDQLNADERCVYCEHAYVSGDLDAANAALDVIAGAVKAALNGNAHPEDILATVGRVIVEAGAPGAKTLEWLVFASRQNMRERMTLHGLEA
jgi:hypothetical protein